MVKEEKIDPINYIHIPTKKYRLKRIPFGRYIVEKQIAMYNLFGPGLQSSRPFDFYWSELTEFDIKELEIDLDASFNLKVLDSIPRNHYK